MTNLKTITAKPGSGRDVIRRICTAEAPLDVQFSSRVFDTEADALRYLDYEAQKNIWTAVRFKQRPKTPYVAEIALLQERLNRADAALADIDAPYLPKTSLKMRTCSVCTAQLPVSWCEKSYRNNCPVCGKDLRPPAMLERREHLIERRSKLAEKLTKRKTDQARRIEEKTHIVWLAAYAL